MSSCEWSVLINTLALAIAKDRSSSEVAFLALLFSQLSSTLGLLSINPPSNKDNSIDITEPLL